MATSAETPVVHHVYDYETNEDLGIATPEQIALSDAAEERGYNGTYDDPETGRVLYTVPQS